MRKGTGNRGKKRSAREIVETRKEEKLDEREADEENKEKEKT